MEKVDGIVTLDAAESRHVFDQEVRQRLGMDASTFIEQWHAGKLDRDNPDVNFLVLLTPIYGDTLKP